MKKYYIWYNEGWGKPQRLATFTDREDCVDFIGITCNNRGYEIEDIDAEELDDEDMEIEKSKTSLEKLADEYHGVAFKLATREALEDVQKYCYNVYKNAENEFQANDYTVENDVRKAAAWNIYQKIGKDLKKYVK